VKSLAEANSHKTRLPFTQGLANREHIRLCKNQKAEMKIRDENIVKSQRPQ